MNLVPKKADENTNRKGSFYPAEFSNFSRLSILSLNSNLSSKSISLLESISSVDSVDIDKIQTINKEFEEIINSRLTAFLYFNTSSQRIQKLSIAESKNSIDSLKEKGGENPENSIILSEFAKEIMNLQRIHKAKLEELKKNKFELETLEDEESGLSGRLGEIEEKISKILIKRDQKKALCKCLVF